MKLAAARGWVFLLGMMMALAGTAIAQSKSDTSAEETSGTKNVTVEGLIRDLACPIQNKKATATDLNLDCAIACAKAGSPLILLTKTGDIYFPITDQMPDADQHDKLMPYIGKYVRVTGTVFERNGTRAIVIQKMTELKDVKLKME